MREHRTIALGISLLSLLGLLTFGLGCQEEVAQKSPVMEVNEPNSPFFFEGQEWASKYLNKKAMDYELVTVLHDLTLDDQGFFLDGFVDRFTTLGQQTEGVAYRKVLEESVSGNQYDTAKELGQKHARGSVTNEQIQGVIHSSLGVSRGVALGWKAGYVKGFAAQLISMSAGNGSLDEERLHNAHTEAAATYYALRAATGQ